MKIKPRLTRTPEWNELRDTLLPERDTTHELVQLQLQSLWQYLGTGHTLAGIADRWLDIAKTVLAGQNVDRELVAGAALGLVERIDLAYGHKGLVVMARDRLATNPQGVVALAMIGVLWADGDLLELETTT